MPKKKGKSKGKSKGKDGGSKKSASILGQPNLETEDIFIDKEQLLRDEYAKVAQEVENTRNQIDDLKRENQWLQEEAQRVRVESHEYMSYMEKKAEKRQRAIISLSDHNHHEIQELLRQREEMLEEYAEKKNELNQLLTDRQAHLNRAKHDLKDLDDCKREKDEHNAKIAELEKQIQLLRFQHAEKLNGLKRRYMNEKQDFSETSNRRVEELAQQAYKEAISSLVSHTNKIKIENQHLRKEVMQLIHRTRILQEHKKKLLEQNEELKRERECVRDMKRFRDIRNEKMLKQAQTFRYEDEGEEDEH